MVSYTRLGSGSLPVRTPSAPSLLSQRVRVDNKATRAMARVASVIPPSLSPHICIISSTDLADILSASSLPPLPQILQSFSPLPQGKTRFIQDIDAPNSRVPSHNEDDVINASASHVFRFALLRLGGNRRWMPRGRRTTRRTNNRLAQ
jgi:hypothetical protein